METSNSSIQVLYIMGYGRSGSTVLDIVLGNHPDVESVGELINLPRSAWINNEFCACGQRANECQYWVNVKQEWIKRTGMSDIYAYAALGEALQRQRLRFQGFVQPDCSSHEFQVYAEQTRALYESIRKVSGKSIIVDSSKNPLRAFVLSFIPGIDLHLIHLVRDGRGVAWSLKKSFTKNEKAGVQIDLKSHPIWRSAITWSLANIQSAWVRQQLEEKKSIQVKYEDFIAEPGKILFQIGQLIGLEFDEVVMALDAGDSMKVGHTVAGNRLRMSCAVKLRLDEEWKQKMSQIELWQFSAIAGWILRKYRY